MSVVLLSNLLISETQSRISLSEQSIVMFNRVLQNSMINFDLDIDGKEVSVRKRKIS